MFRRLQIGIAWRIQRVCVIIRTASLRITDNLFSTHDRDAHS
jgi:hypothetical protein